MAKVSIVMGSDSDLKIMSQAASVLDDFGIEYEMKMLTYKIIKCNNYGISK